MKIIVSFCILIFIANTCSILIAVKRKRDRKNFLYVSLAAAFTFTLTEIFLNILDFENIFIALVFSVHTLIFRLLAYGMLIICIMDLIAYISLTIYEKHRKENPH